MATVDMRTQEKSKKRGGVNDDGNIGDLVVDPENVTNESAIEVTQENIKTMQCKDQFAVSYCESRILRRGKEFCKKDFYFGRVQCCMTCSKAWAMENVNSSGDLSNLNMTSWFEPCADHTDPDGVSFSSWCREFASPKKDNSIFSCAKSQFVRYRCMKTCGLC